MPFNINKNLVEIRKQRGMTQEELGNLVGLSQRMIAYYETTAKQIPSKHLLKLAQILKIEIEQLAGEKTLKESITKEESKLLKNIKKILELPKSQQKAVVNYIDALHIKTNFKKSST